MSYDVKLYRICDHRIYQEEQITEADGKTVITNYPISNSNIVVKINDYVLEANNTSEIVKIEDISDKFDGTINKFVVSSAPIYTGLNLGVIATNPFYVIVQIKVIDEDVSTQLTGADYSFYTNHNPLMTEYNFTNSINIGDVVVKVNGDPVDIADIDSATGRIVLYERPLSTDIVTVNYFYRATIKEFNPVSGYIELAETPKSNQIVRVKYFVSVRDGWGLLKNSSSITNSVVFDQAKQTNRGFVESENVSSQFTGSERFFYVQNRPVMPFYADLRTEPTETLPSSVYVKVNGEIKTVLSVDAISGQIELAETPNSSDIVTVSYWYKKNVTPDVIMVEYQVEKVTCPKCNGLGVLDDIEYDETGRLKIVRNEDKLIQDLRKIVITMRGSNTSHPWYGTELESLIGTIGIPEFIETNISAEIQVAVRNLKNLQSQQIVYQKVTDNEFINAINNLVIEQDVSDPSIWKVEADIISQADTFVLLSEQIEFES